MSSERDRTFGARRRSLAPVAAFHAKNPRGISAEMREAFDAEINATVAEAERTSGASLRLQPTPITSADQITDDLTFCLAFFGLETTRGPKRSGRRLKVVKWSSGEPEDVLKARVDVLEARQERLKHTLRKLVRRGRVDVAAVINALDDARWRYVEQHGRRDRVRLARKLKQMKATADQVLRWLIQYHRGADQMIRGLRGPGTIDEYMAGKTEQLYPESEPALDYMAAHDALLRDGRLTPPFLQRPTRRDQNPPHQELLADVRKTLRRLGVTAADIKTLIRDTGLLALAGADRPAPTRRR